jgi:flagellar motor component MotA
LMGANAARLKEMIEEYATWDRKEKMGDSISLARTITILAIVLYFFFFFPFYHQLPPYTALPYFLAF